MDACWRKERSDVLIFSCGRVLRDEHHCVWILQISRVVLSEWSKHSPEVLCNGQRICGGLHTICGFLSGSCRGTFSMTRVTYGSVWVWCTGLVSFSDLRRRDSTLFRMSLIDPFFSGGTYFKRKPRAASLQINLNVVVVWIVCIPSAFAYWIGNLWQETRSGAWWCICRYCQRHTPNVSLADKFESCAVIGTQSRGSGRSGTFYSIWISTLEKYSQTCRTALAHILFSLSFCFCICMLHGSCDSSLIVRYVM